MSLKVFPPKSDYTLLEFSDNAINDISGLMLYRSGGVSIDKFTNNLEGKLKVKMGSSFSPGITNLNSAFSGLAKVKEIDLSELILSATNSASFIGTFSGCGSLEKIKMPRNFYGISGSDYNIFSNCSSLKSIIGLENTTFISPNSYNVFSGCSSLKSVEIKSFTGGSRLNAWFADCTSLESIIFRGMSGAFNNNTAFYQMFDNTGNIKHIEMHGLNGSNYNALNAHTLDLSNNKIDIENMEIFFDSLGTKTNTYGRINVTGNSAVSDPNWTTVRAIATGKGWTVTP